MDNWRHLLCPQTTPTANSLVNLFTQSSQQLPTKEGTSSAEMLIGRRPTISFWSNSATTRRWHFFQSAHAQSKHTSRPAWRKFASQEMPAAASPSLIGNVEDR